MLVFLTIGTAILLGGPPFGFEWGTSSTCILSPLEVKMGAFRGEWIFAKGMNWQIDSPIELKINKWRSPFTRQMIKWSDFGATTRRRWQASLVSSATPPRTGKTGGLRQQFRWLECLGQSRSQGQRSPNWHRDADRIRFSAANSYMALDGQAARKCSTARSCAVSNLPLAGNWLPVVPRQSIESRQFAVPAHGWRPCEPRIGLDQPERLSVSDATLLLRTSWTIGDFPWCNAPVNNSIIIPSAPALWLVCELDEYDMPM